MESEAILDDVNWKILEELQYNARLSFTELGRRVGLTAPAVAERVRRMEDSGIIEGYRADLNLEKLGLPLLALVRVAIGEGMCGHFAEIAKDIPEVIECRRVTGGDSYVMKAAVTSVRHLEALLDHLTRYGQTVTSLVLSSPVTHRVIVRPDVDDRS